MSSLRLSREPCSVSLCSSTAPAGGHLHGNDPAVVDDRLRNVYLGGEDPAWTVQGHVLPMATALDDQAAVLEGGIRNREPHGQHVGAIGLCVDDGGVLVPQGGGDVGVEGRLR